MKVIFLTASMYEDSSKNYGDCILIDTGVELVIYDCGSSEHADRVLNYMKTNRYSKAKFILSHNDADHFNGLPKLIEAGVISCVYTLLLLKYKDTLLKLINDGRINEKSLTEKIALKYENIYSLSKKATLVDALELPTICPGVKIVGPEKNSALSAVAKFLDGRQGDTIDGETIYNAICFQAEISMDDGKYLLLTGDSAYSMMEENLKHAKYIQLSHHGKSEIAEQVFSLKDNERDLDIKYYVSDNTGNTNGGSDKLKQIAIGHYVKYTHIHDITVEFSKNNSSSPYIAGKTYGSIHI